MKLLRALAYSLLLLMLVSVVSSCKKETRPSWETEILAPFATTDLSLQNLVKDSVLITNPDNSLTLSYKSLLYEFNLADNLVNIPDTSLGQRFSLSDLKLPNQSIDFVTSLGSLAQAMLLSPDPGNNLIGNYILAQNGTTSVIPGVNGLSMPPSLFDATQFLDSAYLTSGRVQVWAVNDLPVPISSGTFTLRNQADSTIITSYTIPYVPARDSVYFFLSISGARITNPITFEVTNISSPGSNGVAVPIDTSDFIKLKIFVDSMAASEAWAKFPPQNVVDITEDVTQEIGERKFTYIDARRGFLHIYITSSVEEQLYLEYTLVGGYDNYGRPIKEFTTVPPALPGQTVTIDKLLDISGCSINLTGKDGTKFNTYTQRIIAHIDSSGITRHITRADSLNVRYEIIDVAPNYIKGYVGKDTVLTVDSSDFAFLDMFKSGSLDLEDVNMTFSVENGIGVDGQVKINALTAVSRNNGTVPLTGSIIGQPLVINRATDFPLTPAVNNFSINSSNSNIKNLIGILPNKLLYDAEVKTNLGGNTQQYRDFAYLESGMKISLNAEVPLSLIANNLVLKDTFSFDISQTNTNVAGITDGIINIIAQNKYPIESNLDIVLYDENWNPVDTLLANTTIQAAELNDDCRAVETKRSKVPVYVSEERMNEVKRARHAVVTASFSTVSSNQICNNRHLKIYSDYTLNVTFTARFNYTANPKF